MKKKQDNLKDHGENAEKICSKIREESSHEEQALLGRARQERERILSEAALDAERQTKNILTNAQDIMRQEKDKIFSAVNIEKRRISLFGRDLFVGDVMVAVKEEAEHFRSNSENYAKFLRDAILEGIGIVDDPKAQVFYSRLDEAVISGLRDIPAEFKPGDFKDIGVVVQSHDGRILFDNRFSARLKRAYETIYPQLLKGAF